MRILAGEFKGRTLLPPPGKSITRPITGSVKKSLFGMLGEDLSGQVVLDLYCGTGTLGIESLSRGATMAYFAERDPRVIDRLKRNLQAVGATDRGAIWAGDVVARLPGWLTQVTAPVDVAFVDPPYAHARAWSWEQVAATIFEPLSRHFAADGVAVLRAPSDVEVPEHIGPLRLLRRRQYGTMLVLIYGHNAPPQE